MHAPGWAFTGGHRGKKREFLNYPFLREPYFLAEKLGYASPRRMLAEMSADEYVGWIAHLEMAAAEQEMAMKKRS